jgi:hypothetical protein
VYAVERADCKGKSKTLGNFFGKKFPKPFKKLYPETALRFRKNKGKIKTLGNFFEKKFSKPFKKLYPGTALRFRKNKGKIKTLENFFEKSFPNLSKNFNLKPRRGSRKTSCFLVSRELNVLALTNPREARVCVRGRARVRTDNAVNLKIRLKPWKTFLKKSFPNLSKNFT